MKNQKVGIIGAGLTGLVAAYRLAQNGCKVELLEKSDTAGGLLSGFEVNGTNLEKAYHHIFKTDTYIIQLINELGLKNKLVWNESSIAIHYKNELQPFVTPLDLIRFKGIGILGKIRLGLVAIWLQKDNAWKKYLKIPAYLWMKKWCGLEAYKAIWEPLLKGKFHDYYKKVSMGWLWARIHTRGGSKDKGGERLGYLIGGFDQITQELIKRIKNKGGVIKYNQNLDHIPNNYDSVLATIPTDSFAKLTGLKYSKIDYLGAVIMVFTSKQSISPYYWHNINDPKSPFLAFIQHTNLIDKKNYKNEHVYYLGAYLPHNHHFFSISNSDLEKTYLDYLEKLFPKFRKSQVSQTFIFRLKNAQHVVDLDYTNKIPDYQTSIDDLYLANFSQIFPEDRGTNFSVREGEKVARLIMSSFQDPKN